MVWPALPSPVSTRPWPTECFGVAAAFHSEDNSVTKNGRAGIAILSEADPTVTANKIHDGMDSGVLVSDGGKGRVEENDIFGNRRAGVAILKEVSHASDCRLVRIEGVERRGESKKCTVAFHPDPPRAMPKSPRHWTLGRVRHLSRQIGSTTGWIPGCSSARMGADTSSRTLSMPTMCACRAGVCVWPYAPFPDPHSSPSRVSLIALPQALLSLCWCQHACLLQMAGVAIGRGGASTVTGNTIRDGNGGSLCLSAQSRGLISANVIHQDKRMAMQVTEAMLPDVQKNNLIHYDESDDDDEIEEIELEAPRRSTGRQPRRGRALRATSSS